MGTAKLWAMSHKDWLKTGMMLVGSSVNGLIINALMNGTHIDWKFVAITALVTALTYIQKQLSTDSDGKVLGKVQT